MSWQDDLRKLDDERAEGVISDAEYRRRSEDLIAAASAAPAGPLPGRPVSHRTSTEEHHSDRAAAEPDSPPAAQHEPDGARSDTPVRSDVQRSEPPTPEPQAPEPRTPEPRTPEPEPSEPLPAEPTRPDALAVTRVPTSDAEPPPASPVDDAFEPTSRRRSRRPRPRRLALLTSGVLVLAVAAVSVWFLGSGGPNSEPGTPAAASRPATVPIPHGLANALDHLPGRRVTNGNTVNVGRLDGLGICSHARAATLRSRGVSQALYLTSLDGSKSFSVTVVPHRNRASAHRTAEDVIATQHRLRLADSDRTGLPRPVRLLALSGSKGTRLRAVYTSGNSAVVLGGVATNGGDDLAAEFVPLVSRVTSQLPPG